MEDALAMIPRIVLPPQVQEHDPLVDYDPNMEAARAKRYSLAPNDVLLMLADQNGVCPICLRDITIGTAKVDHDHKTGKVRGLLCNSCNTGLGTFRDNVEALARAIIYLAQGAE